MRWWSTIISAGRKADKVVCDRALGLGWAHTPAAHAHVNFSVPRLVVRIVMDDLATCLLSSLFLSRSNCSARYRVEGGCQPGR